jgi:hypothetical protein
MFCDALPLRGAGSWVTVGIREASRASVKDPDSPAEELEKGTTNAQASMASSAMPFLQYSTGRTLILNKASPHFAESSPNEERVDRSQPRSANQEAAQSLACNAC